MITFAVNIVSESGGLLDEWDADTDFIAADKPIVTSICHVAGTEDSFKANIGPLFLEI